MKILIYDLETSSLCTKTGYITELGFILIEDDKVIASRSILLKIPVNLSSKITQLTGITDSMLADKKPFEAFAPYIKKLFESCDEIIGHNIIGFDNKILMSSFERAGVNVRLPNSFDTMTHYKSWFGKHPTLNELHQQFCGENIINAHRAINDCKAVYEILKADGYFREPVDTRMEEFLFED